MLDELRILRVSWQIKEEIDRAENQIASFEMEKNYKINSENELHEQNIKDIKRQYGM